ncbi:MAG: hypothetical protein ABIP89_15635 [Polyangiaceae bacterium]
MSQLTWLHRSAVVLSMGFGLLSVGGNCDTPVVGSDSGADGGTLPTGDGSTPADAAVDAHVVAATCAGVCACLAAACPDYPFLPDCVTACQDPTNNPAWDLSCRATECGAAYNDKGAHCPNASGQTLCH